MTSDVRLAIIIPFFQKQQGILSKAIRSVLSQISGAQITVIIIDDESPIPATSELSEFIAANPSLFIIRCQPNKGPASARNTGLDLVPEETDYVAFLDSDDEWMPEHLNSAITALNLGYDFYFSDHYQLGQTVSAFSRAKRINLEEHPLLPGHTHLHCFKGDLFNQIVTGNIIRTSTVVFRWAPLMHLRFREEFFYSGEDLLFWMDVSQVTRKIVFSSDCECRYGKGVNIFSGTSWGSEQYLDCQCHALGFWKATKRIYRLTPEQASCVNRPINTLRINLVRAILFRLKRGEWLSWRELRRVFHWDIKALLLFPWYFLIIMLESISNKGNTTQ